MTSTNVSQRLSAREVQPGHNTTWRSSESVFIEVAREVLDLRKYEIVEKPKTLRRIIPADSEYQRSLGIEPEAAIISKKTGNQVFIEVKTQSDGGNAQERACRYYTPTFIKYIKKIFGYNYHPFVTVFCDKLATKPRFVRKYQLYYEPGSYILWANYDKEMMRNYLNGICEEWLDKKDPFISRLKKKVFTK